MRSADDVYIMPRRIYFPSLLINVCRTKLFKPSVLVLVSAVIRAEAHNLLGCSDFHSSSSGFLIVSTGLPFNVIL